MECLTSEDFGWEIRLPDHRPGFYGWPFFDLELIGIRTWEYQGKTTVGLLATTTRPFAGEEWHFDVGTPCTVLRQLTKTPRRRRRSTLSR